MMVGMQQKKKLKGFISPSNLAGLQMNRITDNNTAIQPTIMHCVDSFIKPPEKDNILLVAWLPGCKVALTPDEA